MISRLVSYNETVERARNERLLLFSLDRGSRVEGAGRPARNNVSLIIVHKLNEQSARDATRNVVAQLEGQPEKGV